MTSTAYITTAIEPITLAGQVFTAEVFRSAEHPASDTVFLTGRRGGVYFLRQRVGELTGRYDVISFKSGAPLRDKAQRPVQVYWLGDVIEQTA